MDFQVVVSNHLNNVSGILYMDTSLHIISGEVIEQCLCSSVAYWQVIMKKGKYIKKGRSFLRISMEIYLCVLYCLLVVQSKLQNHTVQSPKKCSQLRHLNTVLFSFYGKKKIQFKHTIFCFQQVILSFVSWSSPSFLLLVVSRRALQ